MSESHDFHTQGHKTYRRGELSLISFKTENICKSQLCYCHNGIYTHILMTCICKNDYRETLESRDEPAPFYNSQFSTIRFCIPLYEVEDYKYDKIADGNQSYETCVF